ncbi:MAG TPA: LPS assembly protein LptD [Pyrinomonadaceae bacterium]|nr:LPS assembly protein LptD [Pyrinomonadaceae bacterium]
MRYKSVFKIPLSILLACVFAAFSFAQDPNPVDRKVSNPITDTPNINPVSPEQTATPQPKKNDNGGSGQKQENGGAADDEVVVLSDRLSTEGEKGKRVLLHQGNVDVRYGVYRLQADKVTLFEGEGRMLAEGNVVFDKGEDERITGTRAEWNYKTKLGYFVDSTGFTNQTSDGTIIYFTADRVERVSENEIVVKNGKFTACEDAVPQWSFTAKEASIKSNDRVKLKQPQFRVRDIPIVPLPFATIPIEKRDRQSGFLTPTVGYSANKGFRLSTAYYQTLGRSADVTFRGDIYSARGIGFGLDARTRANSRSYFNFGFFAVKDRVFGSETDENGARKPDQGGSLFYAEGVHYFPDGWTASADVRLTSNLAFRQVFSDSIQQVISPIEVSKVSLNKSWGSYSLNFLARSEEISIPNVFVRTRNLPSITFEKRPSPLSFLSDNIYFSFNATAEGVSRRESVNNIELYRQRTGGEPIVTPLLGQRFDVHPQISVPFGTKYFNFTATAGMRVTYYSDSLDNLRQVVSRDEVRKYGELEFDVRPVALAKNYYDSEDDTFKFRHTIEPYLTYRLIKGVDNFNRIIRFDYTDTITDTNEIEYGVVNRIFTRRYPEAVTEEAQKLLREKANGNGSGEENGKGTDGKNPLAVQPYEIFTLTVRQKYFFDETFGEALVPGRRNQIAPITQLTFYTFGGTPRRFSPLSIDGTYRPQKTVFVNTRMDVGVENDGLRAISATVGYDTPLLKVFQTFYYTRAVTLIPSLQQVHNTNKEPGTLRGSQWNPSIFMGDRDKGLFGGTSLFFDFQNSRERRTTPLISSLYTLGYAGDCCSVAVQAFTYNVGVRKENRYVFSFRLKGIGTFGTEQFGQGMR